MADLSIPLKGVTYNLGFSLYKNDGTVIANPGTYTKKIWKDGGAAADIVASVTETDTTYGALVVTLSAEEMTADRVQVYIVDDTAGCVPFTATLYPATASLATSLLDHDVTGHTTAGTVGEALNGIETIDTVVDAINAKTASITAGSVTFTGPVLTSDAVEIVQGADYADDDDMALTWSDTDWPTLTGASVYLVLKEGVSEADETYALTVVSASSIMLELTNVQTDLMDEGTHDFWIIAYLLTDPVRRVPLVHGMWTVTVPPEVVP